MPAPEQEGQEKTEDPTEKRKEDAREKGQVPHSRDAANVLIFLAAVTMFFFLKDYISGKLQECMVRFFTFGPSLEITEADIRTIAMTFGGVLLATLGPLLSVVFVAAAGANLLQFGFVFSPQKLEPKFERLNVVKGLKNMFSLKQLMEGAKTLVKLTLIGVIVYLSFRAQMGQIESMIDETPEAITEHIFWTVLRMVFQVSIFLVVLGVIDFAYQRWEHNRSLRMSRQEVKDEIKQREGDPLVKQRIRQIQNERARQRMMQEVPRADVVVTNPTRLAVALKYDRLRMGAPRVVAKGAGYIARTIRDIARENEVPVVENKVVARLMFKTLKVGQEIPASLYQAVAGILAYVYRTAKKKPDWA